MEVTIQERGWPGHFIGAMYCVFRRNTLVSLGETRIVVSTIGNYAGSDGVFREIGLDRFYETMCFMSDKEDAKYHDADVRREVCLNGPWAIGCTGMDNEANAQHDAAVKEIASRMLAGEFSKDS